jgi:hypothetical protein
MLRWLIVLLLVANLAAAAAVFGAFGPPPAAGPRETGHLARQIHPELLLVHPIPPSASVDVPVVGGPVAPSDIQSQPLSQ